MITGADESSRARAAFSWALHGDRRLMRENLSQLTPAQLDEVAMVACLIVATAGEVAAQKEAPRPVAYVWTDPHDGSKRWFDPRDIAVVLPDGREVK